MSKPVGIPEDVWNAAQASFAVLRPGFDAFNSMLIEETIARAILAERERCAQIVDAECARILALQDGKPENDGVNANLRLVAVMMPELSAAIRKGAA